MPLQLFHLTRFVFLQIILTPDAINQDGATEQGVESGASTVGGAPYNHGMVVCGTPATTNQPSRPMDDSTTMTFLGGSVSQIISSIILSHLLVRWLKKSVFKNNIVCYRYLPKC